MAYTYTLTEGNIVESDVPLDVNQLASAVARLEDDGVDVAVVAQELGVSVFIPPKVDGQDRGPGGRGPGDGVQ